MNTVYGAPLRPSTFQALGKATLLLPRAERGIEKGKSIALDRPYLLRAGGDQYVCGSPAHLKQLRALTPEARGHQGSCAKYTRTRSGVDQARVTL